MSTYIKRLSVLAVFILAGALLVSSPQKVHARDGVDHSQESADADHEITTAQATTGTTYQYVAKKGDNLTLLVRRSVQLYSTSKQTALTDAAIVYCETNIVRNLGSKRLDINDKIDVPYDQLKKYLESSKTLTAAQVAAWQRYAAKANFSLNSITPVNATGTGSSTANPDANVTPDDVNNDEGETTPTPTSDVQTDKSNDKSSSLAWYWWVFGIVGIAVVYYLAGRTNNPKK